MKKSYQGLDCQIIFAENTDVLTVSSPHPEILGAGEVGMEDCFY